MKTIKTPSPMRIIGGSLGAWWLANILNPGFHSVAVMLIFMVPVVVIEIYFTPTTKSDNTAAEILSPNPSVQEDVP